MNEKGNPYAISALKDTRATLAGEIHALKRKLRWLDDQVKHVDATLALFDSDTRALKAQGVIPDDSFITYGNTYALRLCCD